MMLNPALKTCAKCKESQPLDAFYENPGHGDGYRSDCKACVREKRLRGQPPGTVLTSGSYTYKPGDMKAGKPHPPAIKPPSRIKYINGGYLYPLKPDATREALEEFWTKFHMHFCAAGAKERVSLFLFLGFEIPERLTVMDSPQLREQIVKYSHGFGARGWGTMFAWGNLPIVDPFQGRGAASPLFADHYAPDAHGHDAHATHIRSRKGL